MSKISSKQPWAWITHVSCVARENAPCYPIPFYTLVQSCFTFPLAYQILVSILHCVFLPPYLLIWRDRCPVGTANQQHRRGVAVFIYWWRNDEEMSYFRFRVLFSHGWRLSPEHQAGPIRALPIHVRFILLWLLIVCAFLLCSIFPLQLPPAYNSFKVIENSLYEIFLCFLGYFLFIYFSLSCIHVFPFSF